MKTTFSEIKDEVANEAGFENYKDFFRNAGRLESDIAIDEVAQRYANAKLQERPQYMRDYEKSLHEKEKELDSLIEEYKNKNINAINAKLQEAAEKIEQGKDPQSILQCSKETGLGAVTQVYFRKGVNWAKEQLLS